MSGTLIESVNAAFTDLHISKLSVLLGETEGNIHKSIQAGIAAALTYVSHLSCEVKSSGKIFTLSKRAAESDFFGLLHDLSVDSGSLTVGSLLLNKGKDFSQGLLGDRTDFVYKEISRFAGVSNSSASFITGVACFASLDSIGRYIANSKINETEMSRWLVTQRESIFRSIPVGLEIKSALAIKHYPGEKTASTKRNTAIYVAMGIVIVVIAAFILYRTYVRTEVVEGSTNGTDTLVTSLTPANSDPRAVYSTIVHTTLPSGKVLDEQRGGTEDKLIMFLSDPSRKLNKKTGNWFDFTKISFTNNSPNLLLESDTQLKNIVAILDAFPKVKIGIGGYSDNMGDSTDNLRLSQQRSYNVLVKLRNLGAKSGQLVGSKGYGSNFAIGDNRTAEGRAMNRRMSLNVEAK